ncbi:MAG: threonine/serine dehydratase [Candidatus Krumholzibacteria bacterium]|nr:threonine/serine dehydratase [Candidatus Krumholzibacteria bacterium]
MTGDIPSATLVAYERIHTRVRQTPLARCEYLSAMSGGEVFLKLEDAQYTGSFKVRGALNRVLAMGKDESPGGVVTASTGNHGLAVSYALRNTGRACIIFVPENASPAKLERLKSAGSEIRYFGTDNLDTELHARRFADENDMLYLSPYNDPLVIAGQATAGLEISRQTGSVDALFASVGGGGLISGVGGYLKSLNPEIEVVGCSPVNSRAMAESVRAGRIVDVESLPTISDGTAGGIEPGSITFDLCRDIVDRFIDVGEDDIRASLRRIIDEEERSVEGAAAVSLAAFESVASEYRGKKVVIIICGGNIDPTLLFDILSE